MSKQKASNETINSRDGIIGLVVGDAMGVPLEFCIREKLMSNPTIRMLGYGSHDVPKGSWSDDSSMTLATIDAIINDKCVNTETIANNFLEWIKDLQKYDYIENICNEFNKVLNEDI